MTVDGVTIDAAGVGLPSSVFVTQSGEVTLRLTQVAGDAWLYEDQWGRITYRHEARLVDAGEAPLYSVNHLGIVLRFLRMQHDSRVRVLARAFVATGPDAHFEKTAYAFLVIEDGRVVFEAPLLYDVIDHLLSKHDAQPRFLVMTQPQPILVPDEVSDEWFVRRHDLSTRVHVNHGYLDGHHTTFTPLGEKPYNVPAKYISWPATLDPTRAGVVEALAEHVRLLTPAGLERFHAFLDEHDVPRSLVHLQALSRS